MTPAEREAILKAGQTHPDYDEAIDDLWMDVKNLIHTDGEGLKDWLWEGDYRDYTVIEPRFIANEWDSYNEED